MRGSYLFDNKSGDIVLLCPPTESPESWNVLAARTQHIINALACLRRVQELAGDAPGGWREWLDLVEAVMDRDTRGGQEE